MNENMEAMFETDSGSLRINRLQICWGKATIELNPTPGHRNLHTRKFTAKFSESFAEPPVVTHGVHNNSSGHALVVYKWNVTNEGFSGLLNNMYISKSFDGTVTMDFIAIGKARG